jgi:DNA invertase Pin-like site-specific DNA recombinase
VDKVFTDKASGKDSQQPKLDPLLSFVRDGDTMVVHSMVPLVKSPFSLAHLSSLSQQGHDETSCHIAQICAGVASVVTLSL